MIPVQQQPEPFDFSERVRNPGRKFLAKTSNPNAQQWRNREYWQRVLPGMRTAYQGICAYSASWIPHSTGNHSIDHFTPKSERPDLAYEWDNYRYASARFNSRKGTHSIVDPFTLAPKSFVLDFSSFFIKPNPRLTTENQQSLQNTIDRLKLNADEELVIERQTCSLDYLNNEISLAHLQKRYPFIASELERQNLLRPEDE